MVIIMSRLSNLGLSVSMVQLFGECDVTLSLAPETQCSCSKFTAVFKFNGCMMCQAVPIPTRQPSLGLGACVVTTSSIHVTFLEWFSFF